jgi:hypothetical protein
VVYVEVNSKEELKAEIFWEVVISLLNRVKVEGKHVILSDLRDAVCRCRLPEDEAVAEAFVAGLRLGLEKRVFDWSQLTRVKQKFRRNQ